MALKIGITGGIGSGKSVICKVFELLGVPVFVADTQAKTLLNTHSEIKSGLIDLYGSDIYLQNGTINRQKLAGIIFNDEVQLEKVNALVHPVVRETFLNWANEKKAPYVLHEAAILFESGFYKMMDFNILVSAPEKERIKRVVKRDGVSAEKVMERINKQWPDEQKRPLADVEFVTNDKNLLIPQILRIDKQLRENGKIW